MERKGPFGLWMGMTLEELGVHYTEVAPGKYQPVSVPISHSAFESYVLQITPRLGLSWVKAIGRTIKTSAYGLELTTEFDSLERRLSAIYGQGRRTDFLMQGSIWNEPRDRMMAFLNQERVLMTVWSHEHGSSLKDSLVTVAEIANAMDAASGYLAVEYSFENSEDADAEVAETEDQAL
jgi:hypothetical protein